MATSEVRAAEVRLRVGACSMSDPRRELAQMLRERRRSDLSYRR